LALVELETQAVIHLATCLELLVQIAYFQLLLQLAVAVALEVTPTVLTALQEVLEVLEVELHSELEELELLIRVMQVAIMVLETLVAVAVAQAQSEAMAVLEQAVMEVTVLLQASQVAQ
jgi:hypothetical protein